jgi:peroxiredoxin
MLNAGSRAPEIAAADLSGAAKQSLSAVLADVSGPVLLAFFKVSCPTCQFTFPFLQRFADNGVRVIGVSQDSAVATGPFRDRFDLRFPIWLDPASEKYPASNAYAITHVPSLFLVNAQGTIDRTVSGFSREDLETIASGLGFALFTADEAIPAFRPG